MRAKFVGDPMNEGEGPDVLLAFGVAWEKGKARDVPPGAEAKIAGNRHFRVTRHGKDGA